jgi:hypothetical protein
MLQELVKTVQEIRTWREGVDYRLDTLEKTQQLQQEKFTELEADALLVKEEQAEFAKKLTSITQRLERSCTKSIMEAGLLALCLFSVILIIYNILKDERHH